MINDTDRISPAQAQAIARRIEARYATLQFAPLTRTPDTSRNMQRASGRRSSRRFIL